MELINKNRNKYKSKKVVEFGKLIKNMEKFPTHFLKFTPAHFSENFDIGMTPSNGAQTKAYIPLMIII